MNNIKKEEIVSEISIKGNYQKLRATRIEYEKGGMAHIDLRIMQYTEDEEGKEVYIHTKKGFRVQEKDFKKLLNELHSYQSNQKQ